MNNYFRKLGLTKQSAVISLRYLRREEILNPNKFPTVFSIPKLAVGLVSAFFFLMAAPMLHAQTTVDDVLDSAQTWLNDHPYYHATIDMHTSSETQVSNIFRLPDGASFKARMHIEGTSGQIYEYIVYSAQGTDTLAYFPSTSVTVRLSTATQLDSVIGAAGGAEFEAALRDVSTDLSLVSAPTGHAVSATLDAEKMQERGLIPTTVETITVVYYIDDAGKITSIVQTINGTPIYLAMTYVSFNLTTIQSDASALPSPGTVTEGKTFKQAFDEVVTN